MEERRSTGDTETAKDNGKPDLESQQLQPRHYGRGFAGEKRGANRETFQELHRGTAGSVKLMKEKFENGSINFKAKRKRSVEGNNRVGITFGTKSPIAVDQMAKNGEGWSEDKGELNENPAHKPVGFNGIFTSKGSPYKGPIIVDVEKSIKGNLVGKNQKSKEVADQVASGLKWKRKERDEAHIQNDELFANCSRKKKGLGDEGKNLGAVKLSDSVSEENENYNGLGIAEAVYQPRRPQ
jgi:hypothetical protein